MTLTMEQGQKYRQIPVLMIIRTDYPLPVGGKLAYFQMKIKVS